MTEPHKAIAILMTFILILAGFIFGGIGVGKIVAEKTCTGPDRRFVYENVFIWECYEKQPDGTWKPISK